ncbi:MAG: hypothetical protein EPN43_02365 [Jatrophihabitans sp.]|nr:MAG: hypothetical protein EPN43_02365 [Jatrophihabitans sp.]
MSMIPLAIGLGVAAAVVYGASTVGQHAAVHRGEQSSGEVEARHLLRAIRHPRWLLAFGGDAVGFMLQVAALSAGPVVLVQPLTVLILPVALVVGYLFFGQARPRRGDLLGCAAVVGGLAAFLALVGRPGSGHSANTERVAATVGFLLVAGTIACLAVSRTRAVVKGAVFGAVAGCFFGTVGVLIDGASDIVARRGLEALLDSHRALVTLFGIVVLGVSGIVLTQASFQIGKLAATLPANLSADPLTAVVLGAILLREHLPVGPWHLVGYALCLAAVVAGAIRLAQPVAAAGAPVEAARTQPAGTSGRMDT